MGYSKIACPLTNLLKKERKWNWDAECQVAFKKLKDAITSELVLKPPDLELLFEVHMDSLDRALGGVLVQEGYPIAFESRKLDATEKKVHHPRERDDSGHLLPKDMEALLDGNAVRSSD